jgi:hypothetical protein
MEAPTPRPYRSKKHRLCDRCRTRKTSCIIADTAPCQSCLRSHSDCTFKSQLTRRKQQQQQQQQQQSTVVSSASPVSLEVAHQSTAALSEAELVLDLDGSHASHDLNQTQGCRPSALSSQHLSSPSNREYDNGDNFSTFPVFTGVSTALTVQYIRSVDREEGSAAQLLGTSAECDPWLLRHCKYDDYGMYNVPGARFRNVGGVPVERLVPVQFLAVDDILRQRAKEETAVAPEQDQRALHHMLDWLGTSR